VEPVTVDALGLVLVAQKGVVKVLAAVSSYALPGGGSAAAGHDRTAIAVRLEVQQFQDTCV